MSTWRTNEQSANYQRQHSSNMNPLNTIKAYAEHQRAKGYPLRDVEEAIFDLQSELQERDHYRELLWKTLLFFAKADCHPLYYDLIRKESVGYIEEHEFFGEDLEEFRKRFTLWLRPL